MAIVKLGVQSSVIQATSITIVLYVGINLLEFFLNDEPTKSRFFGQLASDMTKAVISGCMAAIAGTFVAGVTTIAFFPLVAAIFVGVLTGWILNQKDKQYQLTEQLIKAIEDASNAVDHGIWKFFNDLEKELEWRIENQIPF